MELDLLPGGEPLRGEVRAFLAGRQPGDDGRGYDPALWASLARAGWLAPRRMADLAVVLSELGRARVPTPVQSGVVQVLAAVPVDGVADGAVRAAMCLAGPGGAVAPGALGATCRTDGKHVAVDGEGVAVDGEDVVVDGEDVIDGEDVVVDGVKGYVPYADSADVFVVAVDGPGDGVSLVTVPAVSPGVRVAVAPSIAGDRQAWVSFSGARGRPAAPLGSAWDRVARAVLVGTAALCAEAVGASAALIERTAAHASAREQFGGPIGRLQSVQHRMADMAIDHLAACGAVDDAIARLDAGLAADAEVAAAKALCGTALLRVAASAHQVWGGTGYLASSGIHEWTRLIKGVDGQLGGAHAQRLALLSALYRRGDWSTHQLELPTPPA
jgi:alkylation response protein AidB-like acyl-CoA dehydrogenase